MSCSWVCVPEAGSGYVDEIRMDSGILSELLRLVGRRVELQDHVCEDLLRLQPC